MKKLLAAITAVLLLGIACAGVYAFKLYSRPGIRHILNMSGYTEPDNYVNEEVTLRVNENNIPVMKYTRPGHHSKTWYILIHGFAPSAHKHPRLNQMAASICHVTGMSVLIPRIPAFFEKNADVQPIVKNIRSIYTALVREYPGKHRAFGACLGGTMILLALQDVPPSIYPGKILLFGPMNDGSGLQRSMNESGRQLDFIVKLAITANMDIFSKEERDLIHNAMMSTSPGRTDRARMKQILGESLYRDISILKVDRSFFKNYSKANPGQVVSKEVECQYFILHSRNDDIIPFSEGKSLFESLEAEGKDVRFYGTEVTGHTENRVTVNGLYHELKYLAEFFDRLFEGDMAK